VTLLRQQGLTTALLDQVGNKFWLVDPDFYSEMNAEFNFTHDPCPHPRPSGYDGLKEPWGVSNWVNPPFVGPGSSRTAWARKAIEERDHGNGSVLILPMDRWVTLLLKAGAEVRVPRDFQWRNAKGIPQKSGRPALLFILRPR
jgi:hypothetical protein